VSHDVRHAGPEARQKRASPERGVQEGGQRVTESSSRKNPDYVGDHCDEKEKEGEEDGLNGTTEYETISGPMRDTTIKGRAWIVIILCSA
jgi:hypothetical protein